MTRAAGSGPGPSIPWTRPVGPGRPGRHPTWHLHAGTHVDGPGRGRADFVRGTPNDGRPRTLWVALNSAARKGVRVRILGSGTSHCGPSLIAIVERRPRRWGITAGTPHRSFAAQEPATTTRPCRPRSDSLHDICNRRRRPRDQPDAPPVGSRHVARRRHPMLRRSTREPPGAPFAVVSFGGFPCDVTWLS